MPAERINRGLSYFERVKHRKQTTLQSEVRKCFEYFQEHSPKVLGESLVLIIHGNSISLQRSPDKKRYTITINEFSKISSEDTIQEKHRKLIKKIRYITIPYSRHVNSAQHLS